MFPHKVDRYRLLRHVLRQARQSFRHKSGRLGLTQKELAKRLGLKQSAVSNLERLKYLDELASDDERKINREKLMSVLTWGLELPHQTIDAILWLAEGQDFRPLDEHELARYARHLGSARPQTYADESILRNTILDCLNELVRGDARSARGSSAVKVWMIFGSDPAHNVKENRVLQEIEKEQGHRMFVSKYPSFLVYSDSIRHEWKRWSDGELVSPEDRLEYARITTERREKFLDNLGTASGVCIPLQAFGCMPDPKACLTILPGRSANSI